MPCPKPTVAEMDSDPAWSSHAAALLRPPLLSSPSVQGPPSSRSFKPKHPPSWVLSKCCRQNSFRSQGPQPTGICRCRHSCGHIVLPAPALDGHRSSATSGKEQAVCAALQVPMAPSSFPTPKSALNSCCHLTAHACPIAAHSSMSPK